MNFLPRLPHAPSLRQRWPVWFLVLLLPGCGKEDIRVYRVPKEKPSMSSEMSGRPASPGIQWKTPDGWKEQPAGGMSAAKFSVPGKDSGDAEVTIMPISATAAKAAVINIWREKIHLPPVKDEELAGQLEKVEGGAGPGELFEMVSTEPILQEKFKARMMVAMISQAPTAWFVKITGEDAFVREQKPVFLSFVKSLTFESGAAPAPPASPHPFLSQDAALPSPAVAASEAPDKPQWEVPSGWQEQPPSQMLLAKFVISGTGESKAEVTVSVFPGDTGGLLANVNRWRGQVGLPPAAQPEVDKQISAVDVMGGRATVADLSGVSPKSGQKVRLIGAIVPREGRTWFYKLMGDEHVAGQQKAAFLRFIQTVRYPNA